ncbi:MAG: hypothetical protein A4E60_02715 [Syntrophorhabdus sp. PtaB.Bin047]|jgi:hypothetical protein|nr:MAG: hypothetical protein A4E60_02715 [Syntrophorhabdus sp. PtaB.Bin047]
MNGYIAFFMGPFVGIHLLSFVLSLVSFIRGARKRHLGGMIDFTKN